MKTLTVTDDEASVRVVVICQKCGSELITDMASADVVVHHSYGGTYPTIEIEPCAECLKRAREEGERRHKPFSHLEIKK